MTSRRLRAIRAMTWREITRRVSGEVRVATERVELARGGGPGAAPLRSVLRPEVVRDTAWSALLLQRHRGAASRFVASLAFPEETRRLMAVRYADECEASQRCAALAAEHTFSFFGTRFKYGPEIDWQADPVSGAQWPRLFHADVPISRGNVGYGDVKHVWELNRHQFLIDLGKSYFLDRTSAHAAEARRLVQRWRADNPYGIGVNWACALEPAFRALSWLWTYHFCLDDPALDADAHDAWLSGFYEHGVFLFRHLEYDASPFNHLIGEAAALYLLGLLFPEFRDADAWRRGGRRVLARWLARQFYADGGSVEQSTFYHHATLGFYLLAIIVGQRNGDPWSPQVLAAAERAIALSMHLALPDGRTPTIGGGDDGKPIRLEHLPLWDFRPYQAIGAVLFDRPDFKYAAGRFHEDALWLLGPDAARRFDEMPSSPPADTSHAFPDSGYFVMRSNWSAKADYVCFDCGEQAGGLRRDDVASAAHGHADCLSVIAALGGEPVLIDPGFYTYNGPSDWEVHFRRTQAHNTATVDGRDQARHVAKMHWCQAASPRLEHWNVDSRQASAAGSHDGFARGANGVVHRRTVWLRPGGYLVIYDQFIGSGAHDIALTFQFAPGAARLAEHDGVSLASGFELSWNGSETLATELACGREDDPDGGWIATSLGVRVAAPRLRLRSQITGPAAVLTILTDAGTRVRPARSRVVARTRRSDGALEAAVAGADFVDWILAPGSRSAGTGMFTSDGTLAIWRAERNGALVEQVRIGGRSMRAIPDAGAWLASLQYGTRPAAPDRRFARGELP